MIKVSGQKLSKSAEPPPVLTTALLDALPHPLLVLQGDDAICYANFPPRFSLRVCVADAASRIRAVRHPPSLSAQVRATGRLSTNML
jgi:hypothetical protein